MVSPVYSIQVLAELSTLSPYLCFSHSATPASGELEEQLTFLNSRHILKGILPTEFPEFNNMVDRKHGQC